MTKPPYRVPSMSEIAKLKGTNGLVAVSTFSGAGGSCLGYEMAGFDLRWASEFIPAAREVYKLNHPGVIVDPRDIRQVKGQDILDAIGVAKGEIDLFDGSPPCAAFSVAHRVGAGRAGANWGEVRKYSDTSQRVDDLFFEFSRLIGETRPRAFVAENVAGLVQGAAKGYFQKIICALKAQGYRVRAAKINAMFLGVPQSRLRLIFVGVRDDLKKDPVFPSPLPYVYTLRDAISDLTSPAHELRAASIERYAIGREWHKLRRGEKSDKYYNLHKGCWDSPVSCVTQTAGTPSAAGVTHPDQPRKYTISELKRICAFPDDFRLTGSSLEQWERLGRAVPPLMMRAIAETVRDKVLT